MEFHGMAAVSAEQPSGSDRIDQPALAVNGKTLRRSHRLLHLDASRGHRKRLACHAESGITGIIPTSGLCRIQKQNPQIGTLGLNLDAA